MASKKQVSRVLKAANRANSTPLDRWADVPDKSPGDVWEVTDGYGKVWHTGTLRSCGIWIDPVLGIELPGVSFGWKPGIDDDRFTVNDDGTITVSNYSDGHGVGGEFTLRKVGA